MPAFENSVHIAKPMHVVFKYVSDFNNRTQWVPGVKSVHQSADRLGIGTMLTENASARVLWYRLDLNADVTEVVPNRRIQFKGIIGRFAFSTTYEFAFSSGGTDITDSTTIDLPLLSRLFSPLIRGGLQSRSAAALATLKQKIESGGVV